MQHISLITDFLTVRLGQNATLNKRKETRLRTKAEYTLIRLFFFLSSLRTIDMIALYLHVLETLLLALK